VSHLLDVKDLTTAFVSKSGMVRAVDGISLHLDEGDVLGLVGESGCGKSVTALSIMRLIPAPGKVVSGSMTFQGRDLTMLNDTDMRQVRGNTISMIFQDPMSSLNPVFTIGDQIAEVFRYHKNMNHHQAEIATVHMLKQVGIPSPEQRIRDYPHQMSGGMRQRVMIAMAMACQPKLMIADEPTTALDVTIQAQILALMNQLREDLGTAILLISHNLGLVAEIADHVAVMYAGKIVESAAVKEVFSRPSHPYTNGLLRSMPPGPSAPPVERLYAIKGMVPSLRSLPFGCRFRDRCPDVFDRCAKMEPGLLPLGDSHHVACWKYHASS
jgi:oligopeptide/dipeptide ABC transporter ATP-binding protein